MCWRNYEFVGGCFRRNNERINDAIHFHEIEIIYSVLYAPRITNQRDYTVIEKLREHIRVTMYEDLYLP